jgi:uncharacterized membrane protein
MKVAEFLNPEQEKQVVEAIKIAEKETSGEIRVHLESKSRKELPVRVEEVFRQLKMHKTALRNGVLFYVATEEKTFAVFGDDGINKKVPEHFWDEAKDIMLNHFKNQDFGTGLSEAILLAGQQLKAHFPYQKDDVNELSDEISKGD